MRPAAHRVRSAPLDAGGEGAARHPYQASAAKNSVDATTTHVKRRHIHRGAQFSLGNAKLPDIPAVTSGFGKIFPASPLPLMLTTNAVYEWNARLSPGSTIIC